MMSYGYQRLTFNNHIFFGQYRRRWTQQMNSFHETTVFPGLYVTTVDVQEDCTRRMEKGGTLYFLFCISGSVHCRIGSNQARLSSGGMVICRDCPPGTELTFFSGFFKGVCILVDSDQAERWSREHLGVLAPDFTALEQRFAEVRRGDRYLPGPKCEHVFCELYESLPVTGGRYLQLKCAELFLLLEKLPLLEQTSYLPREQVELIRHLRDHIISDSENYLSLQSLAEEHEISVSSLQKAFKLVYGMPVYQYLREYRLERAASALQNTQQTVTEIALDAGFHNPAKFAESFKRRYGFTPTAFRKMKNKME